MGISGLLPFLKNSCRSANIKDFSGATVAIDAYSWLHKGAFSCAEKLVKGEKTDGYVFYCIKQLNMLLDAGVKPIMVFDGCNLHSKEVTEKKRRENREKTRQRGKQLLCEGKVKEARECFQRCVDVTPEMAKEVIEACRKKSVDCIVAPYEADAQLAYLDKIGMVEIIITEDSDLVLFGCRNILFKMDSFGGGLLYEKENLPKSFGTKAVQFSFEKFRYMCILSGCDYLPSLPGIGLAKACKFFTLTTNTDLLHILSKLPSYLKMPKLVVSDEYKESFIKANNTFLYQVVFCPKKKALVPLNPYPEGFTAEDMEYAGKYFPDELACQIAMGNINVKTMEEFKDSRSNSFVSVDEDKSILWSTKSISHNSKASSKVENTAFKFNHSKIKTTMPTKRKYDNIVSDSEKELVKDEDLFSMYGNLHEQVSHSNDSCDEEDPTLLKREEIFDHPKDNISGSLSTRINKNVSNTPLQRIVKSRFFVSREKQVESPDTSVSDSEVATVISADGDTTHCKTLKENCQKIDDESHPKVLHSLDNEVSFDIKLASPKKANKENIALHRFAKRKISDFKLNKPLDSCDGDVSMNSNPSEKSWLDIIDSECTVATSTLSSTGKAEKLLCQDEKDEIHAPNSKPKIQIKKLKFVTTKILDFKWTKESSQNKPDISLGSDGNSSLENVPKCEEGTESMEKDIINDIFFNEPINTIERTSPDSQNSVVINLNSSDSDDYVLNDIQCNLEAASESADGAKIPLKSPILEVSPFFESITQCSPSSQKSILIDLTSDTVLPLKKSALSENRKSSCVKSASKPGKCRQIGLSKNRNSGDKKLSRKETLLNFNFIRTVKSEVQAAL